MYLHVLVPLPDDQEYVRSRIPNQVIEGFLQTLIYFLDFLQKEKFSKLKKLRESQASLPIAQFKYDTFLIPELTTYILVFLILNDSFFMNILGTRFWQHYRDIPYLLWSAIRVVGRALRFRSTF